MKGINILFFLSSIWALSSSLDTIPVNQPLTDRGTIISSGGKFKLGFFSPGTSGKRYLGIWFNKVTVQTVVWVANRDSPLKDTSGALNFTRQGILTLLNGSGRVIWSSNSTRHVQNPVAQLLDSGNLVVRDAIENYLWQSFDYPSDTFLPGMKLGVDLNTGFRRFLMSWKSTNDPSKGEFSWVIDLHGFPQPFVMNGSIERYRSGPWNGRGFSNAPSLLPSPGYNYTYVSDQEKISFMYQLTDSSIFARVAMQLNGVLQLSMWNNQTQNWDGFVSVPEDNCDIYGQCQSYGLCNSGNSPFCRCLDKFEPKDPTEWARGNWSKGCVRKTSLNCQKEVKFSKYLGIKLPDTRFSWYSRGVTLNACEELCLRNCSCMAYANPDVTGTNEGCLLWFSELMDIREFGGSGQDIYIKLDSSELGNSSRGKVKKLVISLLLAALGLLLALCLILYLRQKKKKDRNQQHFSKGRGTRSPEMFCTNESKDEELDLPLFDFETISHATNNFSLSNKLGEGGFGPVYKGMLKDGQEIAVKRLSRYSAQGTEEFKNEVIFIAKLQHRNLVKLLGGCIQAEEKMLVYEYMPNNSLDWFLFDTNRRSLLDWPKCSHIINGIARGILYLHQDSRLRIIHRDLKPSNVLLDTHMNPKISDFGMARSFRGNETGAMTIRVVGTYGYMSPEYAAEGKFSVKSDVFSFGVLVLEILSRKRNRGFLHPDHNHNLLGHVWILFKEGRVMEVIDTQLRESCDQSEVQRSVHVGLLCVQQCPEDRPSMASVVLMLSSDVVLPLPKEPGFFSGRNRITEADSSSTKHGETSVNELSISQLDAR
ncbi:G-type lectin S-receptor-like serine/threonine-protein kinase isoform X1 [Capsicum galapagoense]